jgi:hypothetical protein
MTTVANIKSEQGSHWYYADGRPCYEVPKADGSGMTPTTLRHARKMDLLPSVTTVLKILEKPALTAWKIEQAVLAVMTTPRLPGEETDDFIERVLKTDKEQDKERDAAAQLGTDIHAAIEDALNGETVREDLNVYVKPVLMALTDFGVKEETEMVVVGKGYAGRTDALFRSGLTRTLVDFKTTKKIPKESYIEHRLQLAAYAFCAQAVVSTVNVYISTTEPGKIAVCVNEDTHADFKAFKHLLAVWQHINDYRP